MATEVAIQIRKRNSNQITISDGAAGRMKEMGAVPASQKVPSQASCWHAGHATACFQAQWTGFVAAELTPPGFCPVE